MIGNDQHFKVEGKVNVTMSILSKFGKYVPLYWKLSSIGKDFCLSKLVGYVQLFKPNVSNAETVSNYQNNPTLHKYSKPTFPNLEL